MTRLCQFVRCATLASSIFCGLLACAEQTDRLAAIQQQAVENGQSQVAHWGPDPKKYSSWTTHSNRLIPVYTYGSAQLDNQVNLASYSGNHSIYRDSNRLQRLYQTDVEPTLNRRANYFDQTEIFAIQKAALEAGKKQIILVVFDGMDWQTTWAAAIHNQQQVSYHQGRGTGTHFQEYTAHGTSQFGWMVTSPLRSGIQVDVDEQKVRNPGGGLPGGYSVQLAGDKPWSEPASPRYIIAGPEEAPVRHAYTDSASSATSMCSGIKTYNSAIGVNGNGQQQLSIAHLAQASGYRVGIVTSVPISHATPASAYAHNVSRNDYQDLTRDLLGLPSISHPEHPLPGLDVVIGAGHGVEKLEDDRQGENFVPGNVYLTTRDLKMIDRKYGGKYRVSMRKEGVPGKHQLLQDAKEAAATSARLLGFYGIGGDQPYGSGNLPYQTANGDFRPVANGADGETVRYTQADLDENPTLADCTAAAITVLSHNDSPFWLLLEPGDVDWANHANNLDASIGAVNSGDQAVRVVTEWVEKHSSWDDAFMIVTADHGHYLVIDDPEKLIAD